MLRRTIDGPGRFRLFACACCCLIGCNNTAPPPLAHGVPAVASARAEPIPESAATEPDPAPRRTPVARILGTEIFDEDLAPPGDDGSRRPSLTERKRKEYRQEKLASLILGPLMDKYCLTHPIEATQEEIDQYNQAMKRSQEDDLQRLRAEWEAEETTDDARQGLSEQIQSIESLQSDSIEEGYVAELRQSLQSPESSASQKRDAVELIKILEAEGIEPVEQRLLRYFKSKLDADDISAEERQETLEVVKRFEEDLPILEAFRKMPENMVKSWKFNRALYAEFGGVVIFQQMNPFEPVGAYRKWLEAHEAAGDFEILDDEARTAFWSYYKSDHEDTIWVVHDPDPFGQPWWLKTPDEIHPE